MAMTELRASGWSAVAWGQRRYGVNFDAASSALKGSIHIMGCCALSSERFREKRWLQWEANSSTLALHEVWAEGKGITDNAVCIKVGDIASGDIKAINVRDASSPDNTGHIGAIVSVLFEDGSIVLLKFKIKNFTESLLRDVVQFKEGELIDIRSDSYAAAHVPLRQYWFQISNMPPEGILSSAQWISGSPFELAITFGEGVKYCLYARINLWNAGGVDKIWSGHDASVDDEGDSYSMDEWVLRDQSPFQEIISGWIGAKEHPQVLAAGGISRSENRFEKGRALVASVSADGSVALWDAEGRRPILHAPSALYEKPASGRLEPILMSLEEARVSVVSGENYYDILVAASSCRNRLLEWSVLILRVYTSRDRSRAGTLTHDTLYLAAPHQYFSVYATLVDVCQSCDGRSVCSVWRDGLKEKEFLVMHETPDLTTSSQWSNWMADPGVRVATNATMRCVARCLNSTSVLISSFYAMTPLDGGGHDGRLGLPSFVHPSGDREKLVKRLSGPSEEGLCGLLNSSRYSPENATDIIHAVMLKRIFSPGTFTGSLIKSVLMNDVPAVLQLPDSVALVRGVNEVSSSPQSLGSFVADVCSRWAHLLAGAEDDTSMQMDSTFVFSISENSEFGYATRLETAYSNFFNLCAKKSFEYHFIRRGAISIYCTAQDHRAVVVSRRGGVLGFLCDIPTPITRCLSVEMAGPRHQDRIQACASMLFGAYHRHIQARVAPGAVRKGIDDITSRLSIFLEKSHDYSHSNSDWVSEAFFSVAGSISSADLRDIVPVVSGCLSHDPCAVLESLLSAFDDGDIKKCARGSCRSVLQNNVSSGLLVEALGLLFKASYEYYCIVCLGLASIISSPVFPVSLPAGVLEAISTVYFPKAVAELLRVSFLLWCKPVQLDDISPSLSKLGKVDIIDLQPRIAVSTNYYMIDGLALDRIGPFEGRVCGLMSGLMRYVDTSVMDLFSMNFWTQFRSFCMQRLFQLNTPYSAFLLCLVDAKNYNLVSRASSLCRTFSILQKAEDQFNASSEILPAWNLHSRRRVVDGNKSSNLELLVSCISDMRTNIFYIQSLIMKELRSMLLRTTNGGPTVDVHVDKILRLAEDLYQSSELDLSLFATRRAVSHANVVKDAVLSFGDDDLILTDKSTSGEVLDMSKWLEHALFTSNIPASSLINFAEGFQSMIRLPIMALWMQNMHCDNNGDFVDVLVSNFPVIVAACFMTYTKALNMSFIERIRWLFAEREVRSTIALKGNFSCIQGIEAVILALSTYDSIDGETGGLDPKVDKLVGETMRMLRTDMADAMRGSFTNAMEGNFFDEALTVVMRMKDLDVTTSKNKGRIEVDETAGNPALLAQKGLWQSCLRSLVCRVCENGFLGWLCGIPNIHAGSTDISEAIMVELENLACSTELDGLLTAKPVGLIPSLPYSGNYYECLVAFQLSRCDYHGAARGMISLVSQLEGSIKVADLRLQSCLLAAASESLQMLPAAEQFVIQRPSVRHDSLLDHSPLSKTVDAQGMISLVSVPSLYTRATETMGVSKVLERSGNYFLDTIASPDTMITKLCDEFMFYEALSVAYRSTTMCLSGDAADGLDPLSVPLSSIAVTSSSGLGLFVNLLTRQCCDAANSVDEEQRKSAPGSSACCGHLGHLASPLSTWLSVGKGFKVNSEKNDLWRYLAAVLRSFDGPQMGNWGLHRVAVMSCMSCRPGRTIPQIIVRSYCGDLLVPANKDGGRGNGSGLLRLLYENGHLLEACDLSTRIIKDSVDTRNKNYRSNSGYDKKSPEPLIPFVFLDMLLSAVDRVLASSTGTADFESASTRAVACAMLSKSQCLLKESIEILIKVKLIQSYDKKSGK